MALGLVADVRVPQAEPNSNLHLGLILTHSLAMGCYIYGLVQSYRGNLLHGASSFVIGVYIALALEPVIHDSGGLLWALILTPLMWLVCISSLPTKTSWIPSLIAFVLGATLIGFDLLQDPLSREGAPEFERTIFAISLSIVAIFVVFLIAYNFHSFNLQTKFVIATACLAVAGVVATSVLVTNSIRQIIIQDVENDLRSLAQFRADTLSSILFQATQSHQALHTNREMKVTVIQANQEYERLTQADLNTTLIQQASLWESTPETNRLALTDAKIGIDIELFQSAFPKHRNVIITSRYGTVISASASPDQFNHSDEAWWQSAYDDGIGQTFIGDPIVSEENGTIYLPIATPIYAAPIFPDAKPVGVLYSEYDLTEDILLITSYTTAQNDNLAKLVINDYVIENQSGVIRFYNFPLSADDIATLNTQQFLITTYQEAENMLGYSGIHLTDKIDDINTLNWGILVTQTVSTSEALVNSQQRAQNLSGVLIVVIGIGVAFLIGRLVAGPILRLSDVGKRLAEGERGARAAIETGDEIAALAGTLNLLAARTEEDIELLEQRVAERTHALETSFNISQKLLTILDRTELAQEIVKQLQIAFHFYHTHVYILDESSHKLNLASGSGEIGNQLLARHHAVDYGNGLVGRAASTNRSYLVPDVSGHPDWIANDLLPDTKAELSVPVAIGDIVFGVIDIQEDKFGRLTSQTQQLVEAIAAQTAVAFRNAQYVEEAQRKAEQETLINGIRDKIQRTNDVESALKTAVRELGTALQSTQSVVQLKQSIKPKPPVPRLLDKK